MDTSEMKDYIGTKQVKAMPCTAAGAAEILNREICADNANENGDGYLVQYKDGYTSWSPAAVFEEAYKPIAGTSFGAAMNPQPSIDSAAVQRRQDMVMAVMSNLCIQLDAEGLNTLTILDMWIENGLVPVFHGPAEDLRAVGGTSK